VAKPVTIFDVRNHLELILEDNLGIIDNKLFILYHDIKSEQYFEDFTGGDDNYKYLAYYASLLDCMLKIDKSVKLLSRDFKKDVKYLYYQYRVWFFLMYNIRDWEKVENILRLSFHFKRSYKTISRSILLRNVSYNKRIGVDEFIKLFNDYAKYEIAFPILHKYFWQR
jgi:hypothetical protein